MPIDSNIPMGGRSSNIDLSAISEGMSYYRDRRDRERNRQDALRQQDIENQRRDQIERTRNTEDQYRQQAQQVAMLEQERQFKKKKDIDSLYQKHLEIGEGGALKLNENNFVKGLASLGYGEDSFNAQQELTEKADKKAEADYNRDARVSKRSGEILTQSMPYIKAINDPDARLKYANDQFKKFGIPQIETPLTDELLNELTRKNLAPGSEDPVLAKTYNEQFLTQAKPLLEQVKSDPSVVTDIAYMGEKMGLGSLKRYQDFINNIKGVNPFQQQGMGMRQAGQAFDQEQNLQNKYLAQTKAFRDIRDSYSQIKTVGKNASAAGDLSLIFSFMKMLDPGSTVREGEFATAAQAGSVPERIWGQYNKMISGERLTPGQREDFIRQASNLYRNSLSQAEKTKAQIKKLAIEYGLNPDRVTMDLEVAEEPGIVKAPKAYSDPAKEARYQASLKARNGAQPQAKKPIPKPVAPTVVPVKEPALSKEERYQEFLKNRGKK